MGPVKATITCFSKYATFSGRATRSEYWWFYLTVTVIGLAARGVDYLLFGDASVAAIATDETVGVAVRTSTQTEPLTMAWSLVVILPLLAAGWRRAHDTGRPGWYILLPAIAALVGLFGLLLGVAGLGLLETFGADPALLGGAAALLGVGGMLGVTLAVIALSVFKIILLVQPSDPQANEYGPNPHEVTP
ncbi:MAG: DUF805 domain-containing protein [Marinibacterium sp.]